MSVPPPISISDHGAVRVLTLDRPDRLNVVDEELQAALLGAVRELECDTTVRAAVITGAGRAFSAGGDRELIRSMQIDREVRDRTLEAGRSLFAEMTSLRVPVVAAVNGAAVGAGCTLALLCDVVIMAETAFLADPHVSIGLVPGDGGVVLWPQLAGLGRAKAYLLTGDAVSAAEAWRLGLVHEVAADPLEVALALAERIATRPAFAVQETKRALDLHLQAAEPVFVQALESERRSFDDAEHRERTR